MNSFHLIETANLSRNFYYARIFPQQLFTLTNFYYVEQQAPFIPNFSNNLPLNQNPIETIEQQPNLPIIPPHVLQAPPRSSVKKGRRKNIQKEKQSAKKNSESNIINQLYSFFNSFQKSQKIVDRAIKLLKKGQSQIQKIKTIFYNTVRLINYNRGRRYVNKQSIKRFYTPANFMLHMPEMSQKLQELRIVTLEELCLLFRVCTYHFIKNISVSAVLSSKRISTLAKKQHLKRKRLILSGLKENNE